MEVGVTETQDDATTDADELAGLEEGYRSDGPIEGLAGEEEAEGARGDGDAGEDEQPGTETPQADPIDPRQADRDEVATKLSSLEAKFAQRIDTAFGKLGGVERTLRELQAASAHRPAIEGEWTTEDFKELVAEFPEVAELIVRGVNAGFGRLKTAAPTGPPPASSPSPSFVTIEQLQEWQGKTAEQIEDKVTKGQATQFLYYLNKDWQKIVGGKDEVDNPYRQWLATQPEDDQRTMAETWNPITIHESIEKFKTYQASQKKSPPPAPSPNKKDERQRALLKAAVPAKASSRVEHGVGLQTEEDGFMAGYKA